MAIGVGRQVDDVTEFWILEEEREEHRWNGGKKNTTVLQKGWMHHACMHRASEYRQVTRTKSGSIEQMGKKRCLKP